MTTDTKCDAATDKDTSVIDAAKARFWARWGVTGMPAAKIRLAEAAWEEAVKAAQAQTDSDRPSSKLEAGVATGGQPAIEVLIRHARGEVSHLYQGACPDSIEGGEVRDDRCPVCAAISALGN